ncbi:MAG: ATP-dependent sacrificial sulfur transferase LarE [Clostridium sp.]
MNQRINQRINQNEHVKMLQIKMQEYGAHSLCLAFSGGVDSSLLLKLACDSTKKQGNTVYAVTFDTALHPTCDLENAKRVAAEMDAIHVILKIDELEMEEIRNNPVNRCYLCKKHLFQTLRTFATEKGITCILDGTNEDDLHVYRPGIKALGELGIKSPLAESHMTKAEVKELAGNCGISVASRPSTPCMATRLPYGTDLNYALLKQIEEGERYLKSILTGNIRLRVHRDIARIEIDCAQMPRALELRTEIAENLKKLGFAYVTLDLEGFRSGSMDIELIE